jgi:hypothetical protein
MNGSMRVMKIASAGRWRHWARSIARASAAHGPVTRRRALLAFVLRRRPPLSPRSVRYEISQRHFNTGGPLFLQPVIRLALYLHSSTAQPSQRSAPPATTFARRASKTNLMTARAPLTKAIFRRSTTHINVLPERTLVREMVERTRRIEERVTLRTKLAQRSGEAAAPEDRRTAPPGKRSSDEWWKSDAAEPLSRRASSISPTVNVDQIAESVMRQLDRRVGAWRERMGRT